MTQEDSETVDTALDLGIEHLQIMEVLDSFSVATGDMSYEYICKLELQRLNPITSRHRFKFLPPYYNVLCIEGNQEDWVPFLANYYRSYVTVTSGGFLSHPDYLDDANNIHFLPLFTADDLTDWQGMYAKVLPWLHRNGEYFKFHITDGYEHLFDNVDTYTRQLYQSRSVHVELKHRIEQWGENNMF